MDKRTFQLSFFNFLSEDVQGLSSEKKVKYMKKWLRDYEKKQIQSQQVSSTETINIDNSKKIGILVRTTIRKMVSNHLLSTEKIKLLQDEKYCKYTFDINYPFLKKIVWNEPLLDQRKINGYDRYWAEEITIHNERYLICNDWYERNKPKFISWIKKLD